MSAFLDHGGFESSVGVIGLVNGQDGVAHEVVGGEADKDDEDLPHEGVSLEDEGEVPPHALDGGVGVECGDDLGLPA